MSRPLRKGSSITHAASTTSPPTLSAGGGGDTWGPECGGVRRCGIAAQVFRKGRGVRLRCSMLARAQPPALTPPRCLQLAPIAAPTPLHNSVTKPLSAQSLTYELDARVEGAPGGDQVVHQQHALPRLHGAHMHLNLVGRVLGHILLAHGLPCSVRGHTCVCGTYVCERVHGAGSWREPVMG